jgi:hypothetical protein
MAPHPPTIAKVANADTCLGHFRGNGTGEVQLHEIPNRKVGAKRDHPPPLTADNIVEDVARVHHPQARDSGVGKMPLDCL